MGDPWLVGSRGDGEKEEEKTLEKRPRFPKHDSYTENTNSSGAITEYSKVVFARWVEKAPQPERRHDQAGLVIHQHRAPGETPAHVAEINNGRRRIPTGLTGEISSVCLCAYVCVCVCMCVCGRRQLRRTCVAVHYHGAHPSQHDAA